MGPYELSVGPDLVRRFGEATLDHGPLAREGRFVPPCLLATRSFRAQYLAINELVPVEIFAAARSGVHGEHELLVHRVVGSGERLRVFIETHSAWPAGENLRVTLRHLIHDDRDDLVAEQWWTTVLLGTTAEPTGPRPPDLAFSSSGISPLADDEMPVDDVMARRYAEVSGDFSEHHFSVEGARRSGFDAPFLHGLCTMALCRERRDRPGGRRRSEAGPTGGRPIRRAHVPRPAAAGAGLRNPGGPVPFRSRRWRRESDQERAPRTRSVINRGGRPRRSASSPLRQPADAATGVASRPAGSMPTSSLPMVRSRPRDGLVGIT